MQRSSLLTVVLAVLSAGFPVTAEEAQFRIRIENTSQNSALPTPFSPGVWVLHTAPGALFEEGTPDRGRGLVAIAEDGNPMPLATALSEDQTIAASAAFATPVGAAGPAPIFPGEAYEFTLTANPSARFLSLATMLVHSNDIFAAPAAGGIALFDAAGAPLASADLTDRLLFWDVGSEMNEAPGMGPNQAPRQSGPDTGPSEGVVDRFSNTTRGMPLARSILDVHVETESSGFTVTLTNISAGGGAMITPVAPVFWALHDTRWSLFEPGSAASAGLETLAEDGGPGGLIAEHTDALGIGSTGAQPITRERPDASAGPAFPGESFQFSFPRDPAYPRLTIAAMVVESNDAFFSFHPEGVPLYTEAGTVRLMEDINADIRRNLAIWDAGTEANEVPGAGPNQVVRQSAPNTGPRDPINHVRLYADPTDDLAGEYAGGFAMVEVAHKADLTFDITVRNTSGETAYPGLLTPVAWAVHGSSMSLFTVGTPASAGLERLAEDGDASLLAAALGSRDIVLGSGVANIPVGRDAPGPLTPGDAYTFEAVADAGNPFLSIASMVVPSNDTFIAFEPSGVRLLTEGGAPRASEEIAADIRSQLRAWDAGTERNQSGAGGPDQAPRQAAPDTGADEGSGLVRRLDDPVWSYPEVSEVLRMSIRHVGAREPFVRGDANADGDVDMSDAMASLGYFFAAQPRPICMGTLDANDSGGLNIADPVYLLNFLFQDGAAIPAPFEDCGEDPTLDDIDCESYPPCRSRGVSF